MKQKRATNLITKYVAVGMHPLRTVDERGFIELVEGLDPKVTVPSRKKLSTVLIPELYESTRQVVAQQLYAATDVAITFDLWTSRATDQYIGVTAHFLDASFHLRSFVLESTELPPPHTSEAIAERVLDIMLTWRIEEKVSFIVSDNAANCIKAIRLMEKKFVPCMGHILHLAVCKGLGAGIDKVMAKCSKVAEYFHRSGSAKYCLEEKQRSLGLANEKLIMKCDTRWNSIYDMLRRIVTQQQAIVAALLQLNRREMFPEADMVTVESLLNVLKPFKDVTDDFSMETGITISLLLPTLISLQKTLDVEFTDEETISAIKSAMRNSLDTRYTDDDVLQVLGISCFLDPRLKVRVDFTVFAFTVFAMFAGSVF